MSGALYLNVFEQPAKSVLSSILQVFIRLRQDTLQLAAERIGLRRGFGPIKWRGDRAVARESEGGWGFSAIPLKRYPAACCGEIHLPDIENLSGLIS